MSYILSTIAFVSLTVAACTCPDCPDCDGTCCSAPTAAATAAADTCCGCGTCSAGCCCE